MDRAPACGAVGRRFNSCRARYIILAQRIPARHDCVVGASGGQPDECHSGGGAPACGAVGRRFPPEADRQFPVPPTAGLPGTLSLYVIYFSSPFHPLRQSFSEARGEACLRRQVRRGLLMNFPPLSKGRLGGVMKTMNSKKCLKFRKALRNNRTRQEYILWKYLKGKQVNGYKFRRQHSIGKYIVDFYCPELNLAIEIDGANHFFDDRSEKYDTRRQKFIEQFGIRVLRIGNGDIMNNIKGVLEEIYKYSEPPLAPPLKGGE